MYYTPRGKDLRKQYVLDVTTAQKFLDISVFGKDIVPFFHYFQIEHIVVAPFNHFCQCLIKVLEGREIKVEAIADRMSFKWPGGYRGIEIVDYDRLPEKEFDAAIITSNFHKNAIMDTMLQKNIPLEKIIGINTILFGTERLP